MSEDSENSRQIGQILDAPDLAISLESDLFKQFLDHVPVAIAVAELQPSECITYANIEFERLTAQPSASIAGKRWDALPGTATSADGRALSEAVTGGDEYIGSFTIAHDATEMTVDAWSNVIQDEDGTPLFRLVALAEAGQRTPGDGIDRERRTDSDTLLRELQHRVKNNLQMITALIRLEARNIPDDATGKRFDRLAGRIDALALLYRSLSEEGVSESIDLGIYLSEIASSVMRAHAVEGIHLDLQVDTWPVSVNVAMPTGLVVNELLTNALKHAFAGRDGGTISLHSIVDETGCRVVVADDGIGLAEGVTWPKAGKLGALIVQSLRQNAKAQVAVESAPGAGVRVTIFFARSDAAPKDA
ncbi:MAG: histidine kinase [Sphingomonas bacterium]|uniref:sensor histidine kinase n=1 Tax=Sphingomonas bacterium TaxID=1895847 RepID=UPI002619E5DE|nr:sensor histidine kinase [Sphingomonas bacterium]MDB5705109.1 histidine kinase [Sphingomonas bacterium]